MTLVCVCECVLPWLQFAFVGIRRQLATPDNRNEDKIEANRTPRHEALPDEPQLDFGFKVSTRCTRNENMTTLHNDLGLVAKYWQTEEISCHARKNCPKLCRKRSEFRPERRGGGQQDAGDEREKMK